LELKFRVAPDGVIAEYQGSNIYHYLMQNQIGTIASKHIAQDAMVREALLPIQREYALNESLVCEGRDMASVVFPECDVAVYLTATLSVRNRRRGIVTAEDEKTLAQRDLQDMSRKVAPLTIHPKSHIIDTSYATSEQVVDHIMALIQ
jgi:cytidylate kinase